jgi:hypothetical protein
MELFLILSVILFGILIKYALFNFLTFIAVIIFLCIFITVILGLIKLLLTPIVRPIVKGYNLIPQRIKDKAKDIFDKAKDIFFEILGYTVVIVSSGIPVLIIVLSIFAYLWHKINEYDWYIFG